MGYPNVAMLDDKKADELMDKAMTDYHKYLLKQFPWAPIYLPPGKHSDKKQCYYA